MKRTGGLFDRVFSEDNLYLAYLDARRGKRKKRACFEFEINLGYNLRRLYNDIQNGTYEPDPYFKFIVYEPKERIIYAPSFADIVVQHAIYRIVYPIFNRTFISTSFACRIGYGTHKASRCVLSMIRKYDDNLYSLKLDVRKFFYSINRSILEQLIRKKIKDDRLVNAMMLFTKMDSSIGIPIGNLLSQLYALIYLNPVDHFIKRELKINNYARYVDDMVIVGLERDECLMVKIRVEDFLATKLDLKLSKHTIQKIGRGINFVGYRMWKNRVLIRKYSLCKFKRFIHDRNIKGMISILGHAKTTNSLPHMIRTIYQVDPLILNKLPRTYRKAALKWISMKK